MPPTRTYARIRAGEVMCFAELLDELCVELDAAPWLNGRLTGRSWRRDAVRFLAPVTPSKIVCVGLNYREHIAESVGVLGALAPPADPLLFLKPSSAIVGPGEPIRYPKGVTRLDPEAELGVVIGRELRRASAAEAAEGIAGLTVFNDVSARNYQKSDGQWTRAKGFDTFAPVGPVVVCGLASEHRIIELRVNGELRQRGDTADLIVAVPELLRYISGIMTLYPGDLIATGTPAGIAPVSVGDQISISIDGIGTLDNPVAEDHD